MESVCEFMGLDGGRGLSPATNFKPPGRVGDTLALARRFLSMAFKAHVKMPALS